MTVRMMRCTDRGAPTLAGQQGSMCALLLATLVTGFPAAAPVGGLVTGCCAIESNPCWNYAGNIKYAYWPAGSCYIIQPRLCRENFPYSIKMKRRYAAGKSSA